MSFEVVGEEVVYDGHFAHMVVRTLRAADGTEFTRDVLLHPGWVAVVPLTDDGDVVCVRQHRAALGLDLLEIPAGIRDVDGEPDEGTARRELAEEVGLACEHLELLATVHNSPGITDEQGTVYLATGLTEVGTDLQGPEEQAMTIERIPVAAVLELIATGQVTDAKTIIGFSLVAAARLQS